MKINKRVKVALAIIALTLTSFLSGQATCPAPELTTYYPGIDRIYWNLNGSADYIYYEVSWEHYGFNQETCWLNDSGYEDGTLSGSATYYDFFEELGLGNDYKITWFYIEKVCGGDYGDDYATSPFGEAFWCY